MATRNYDSKKAGSRKKVNEPRHLSEILTEYFAGNSPLARAYRGRLFENVFPHTEPCCQLKLLTHQPGRLQEGKMLDGVIMRDDNEHYVFVQNHPEMMIVKRRSPHFFRGVCVNVTQNEDGSLRPTFNRPKYSEDYGFSEFCLEAAQELIMVASLVENE